MSGRKVKAGRRAEREHVAEMVLQAHDRIHHGDTDAAHEFLHAAAGIDNDTDPAMINGLGHMARFDVAFVKLCRAHGIRSAYVSIDPRAEVTEAGHRLISGGDAGLSGLLDRMLMSTEQAARVANPAVQP